MTRQVLGPTSARHLSIVADKGSCFPAAVEMFYSVGGILDHRLMIQRHGEKAMLKNMTGHIVTLLALMLAGAGYAADEESGTFNLDGLVAVEESQMHAAYIDPEADFSVFRRVSILDPHVAFRSNWQRDQNRSRSRNVRTSDIERIKEDVAGLFKDVFVERLEAAGYEVVNYADEDVLVLRPAIIDLDVTAPDTRSTGRQRTYTASTGAATLFIELFDSLSGDLIGRAADRRSAGNSGGFAMQANRVTDRNNARREFIVWADRLIAFLDSHYVKASKS